MLQGGVLDAAELDDIVAGDALCGPKGRMLQEGHFIFLLEQWVIYMFAF